MVKNIVIYAAKNKRSRLNILLNNLTWFIILVVKKDKLKLIIY